MDEDKFVEEFKKCKIKAIDIAFKETSSKLGIDHTRKALKYILFDDKSGLDDINSVTDKFFYISSRNGGRELLKLLDIFDIYQILCRHAMEMCAINNLNFTRIEKEVHKNVADNKKLEYLTNLLYRNPRLALDYLEKNCNVVKQLFDSLIDNRYKKNMLNNLDSASKKMDDTYRKTYDNLGIFFDQVRVEKSLL